MRGTQIAEVRSKLMDLNDKYEINNLLLNVGSNEIPLKDPLEVARELSDLITEIKVYMPATKLYVSAIFPKIGPEYLPGINEINFLICCTCDMLRKLTIVYMLVI